MDDAEQTVYETYAKISEMAERLHGRGFIYCHAAYLVNARQIADIEQTEFTLLTGERIPISRQKYLQAQKCPTARSGRHQTHFKFGAFAFLTVQYSSRPQIYSGSAAYCRSLV